MRILFGNSHSPCEWHPICEFSPIALFINSPNTGDGKQLEYLSPRLEWDLKLTHFVPYPQWGFIFIQFRLRITVY